MFALKDCFAKESLGFIQCLRPSRGSHNSAKYLWIESDFNRGSSSIESCTATPIARFSGKLSGAIQSRGMVTFGGKHCDWRAMNFPLQELGHMGFKHGCQDQELPVFEVNFGSKYYDMLRNLWRKTTGQNQKKSFDFAYMNTMHCMPSQASLKYSLHLHLGDRHTNHEHWWGRWDPLEPCEAIYFRAYFFFSKNWEARISEKNTSSKQNLDWFAGGLFFLNMPF